MACAAGRFSPTSRAYKDLKMESEKHITIVWHLIKTCDNCTHANWKTYNYRTTFWKWNSFLEPLLISSTGLSQMSGLTYKNSSLLELFDSNSLLNQSVEQKFKTMPWNYCTTSLLLKLYHGYHMMFETREFTVYPDHISTWTDPPFQDSDHKSCRTRERK